MWHGIFGPYGADKIWKQIKKEGIRFTGCTVERLMRKLGTRGIVCGNCGKTKVPDPGTDRPVERAER